MPVLRVQAGQTATLALESTSPTLPDSMSLQALNDAAAGPETAAAMHRCLQQDVPIAMRHHNSQPPQDDLPIASLPATTAQLDTAPDTAPDTARLDTARPSSDHNPVPLDAWGQPRVVPPTRPTLPAGSSAPQEPSTSTHVQPEPRTVPRTGLTLPAGSSVPPEPSASTNVQPEWSARSIAEVTASARAVQVPHGAPSSVDSDSRAFSVDSDSRAFLNSGGGMGPAAVQSGAVGAQGREAATGAGAAALDVPGSARCGTPDDLLQSRLRMSQSPDVMTSSPSWHILGLQLAGALALYCFLRDEGCKCLLLSLRRAASN